jgi:hypothetical protein
MANLKNINETELLKRIDESRQRAIDDIERAAESARTDVVQAVSAAKTNAPGLTDLAARADVALVVEQMFGSWHGMIDKDAPPCHQQFVLNNSLLGETEVKPGKYRVFLFALRIE